MKEDHDVVSVYVELKSVVGEYVVVAEATLERLRPEGRTSDWQKGILLDLGRPRGESRRAGPDSEALRHPRRVLYVAIRQGAHMVRTEVTEVNYSSQSENDTYTDDTPQSCSTRTGFHSRVSITYIRRQQHHQLACPVTVSASTHFYP